MNTEQTPPPRAERSGCVAWFILGLACIGMAIVLISIGWRALFDIWNLPGGGEGSVAIGQAMPGLDLMPITRNEKPVSLADLSGKVTLINFWATWCPPPTSARPTTQSPKPNGTRG